MATIGVVFDSVTVQYPPPLAGADEPIEATFRYALTCDGEYVGDFSSRIKADSQLIGEPGSFEAEPPEGYDGPFSLLKFARLAEDFYRWLEVACTSKSTWSSTTRSLSPPSSPKETADGRGRAARRSV
jgi:hypothetical protein